MKFTRPRSWKAEELTSDRIIKGATLTTDGRGQYSINSRSSVDVTLSPRGGWDVKPETICWECANCGQFMHRSQIKCTQCNLILEKCQ